MEITKSKYGDAQILRMVKRDQSRVNVWAPGLLRKALVGKTLPCFIMPMGNRKCKNDDKRTYHAFELLSGEEFEKPQMEDGKVSNDLPSTAEDLVVKKYFNELTVAGGRRKGSWQTMNKHETVFNLLNLSNYLILQNDILLKLYIINKLFSSHGYPSI